MYLALGLQIPQEVTDGIILLDQQGNILSHNHAANTLVQQGAALRTVLKRAVESEARSGEALPKQLEFYLGAFNQPKRKTKAWLCRYGAKEFAIFVAPDADALAQAAHVDENRMSPVDLLGDRVREKMADLRRLLRGGAGAVARDEAAIAATSDQLDQLLAATSEFAQLLQRDQVFDDERLNLAEQIRHIVPDLWGGCGVRYVISPPVGLQGMVYGNAAWLRRALKSLIESLGCSAPPQSDVAIGQRQLGDFVMITGNVLARRNTHPAGAIFFSPQGAAVTSAASCSDISRSMEPQMCRRIVELHAGQLHLEYMLGSDGVDSQLESFTLSLATGLPVHERSRLSCAECRHTQQAQAYAVDMELLLSRNPNATSGAQYHDKNSDR